VETSNKFSFIQQKLAQRHDELRLRSLRVVVPHDAVHVSQGNRILLNFSSNDYLGLSKHPALIAAAQQYTAAYGTGSTASRLVTGTYEIHSQLEQQLAIAYGQEACLLFNSGFQANLTVLSVLLDHSALVLCDRFVHNSILQGILASRARLIRYRHNDLDHLEHLLKKASQNSYSRILIASETIFSMDGDRSDVAALIQLAHYYNAILYLDDAHALGVMGQQGMGLAAQQAGIDVVVGTFGKAFGAFGAFIACSQLLKDYLVNYCPGFIYTTALPPAVIGAIAAALQLIPTLEAERQYLQDQAAHLRTQLQHRHQHVGASCSQIVPLIIGAEAQTLQLAHWLETQGILATAIRPPTVEVGTARIRFALSSHHSPEHLQYLIDTIQAGIA